MKNFIFLARLMGVILSCHAFLTYEARACGSARVIAGNTCENLFVRFDLSDCGIPTSPDAKITCQGDSGEAVVESSAGSYFVALSRAGGAWSVSGTVQKREKTKSSKKSGNETGRKPRVLTVVSTPAPVLVTSASVSSLAPVAPVPPPAATATPVPTAPSASTPTLAPAAKNDSLIPSIVVKGQFRYRLETSNKTDLSSYRNFSVLRVRPDISATLSPDASLFVQPQFAKTLGEPVYVGSSTTGNTKTDTSGTTTDVPLSIHQAYGDYHPIEAWHWLVGRQVLSYGNELLVGALDWQNVGRSFDGVKTRYNYGLGWTDLFSMKTQDNNTTGSGSGDKDFSGLYNGWNFGPYAQSFDLYTFYLRDSTGSAPTRLWTYGTRMQSNFSGFDYRFEATKQDGVTTAHQEDLELGYTWTGFHKTRIAAEWFYASQNFNQLFPTAHKWLGYADVFGRRNITGGVLHLSSAISESLGAQLDYHQFYRADRSRPAYKLNGTTPIGSATGSSSKDLGSEIDLTLKYQASRTVGFSAGGSIVFLGSYFSQQMPFAQPNFYYLQMEMKF